MSSRTIKDVLDGQVLVTATGSMSVTEVARRMKKAGLSAILILEDRRLVGIFTEHDALFRVAAEGLDPNDTAVASVMTENPTTIGPGKPFSDALAIMHAGRFRRVPVVENLDVIGMVSSSDAMGPELEQFMYATILEDQITDVLA
ncbi:MAG: CBS domain-containing protein [Gammaproteobacteria bacterium]|jgi:CBS domain-containing protein